MSRSASGGLMQCLKATHPHPTVSYSRCRLLRHRKARICLGVGRKRFYNDSNFAAGKVRTSNGLGISNPHRSCAAPDTPTSPLTSHKPTPTPSTSISALKSTSWRLIRSHGPCCDIIHPAQHSGERPAAAHVRLRTVRSEHETG